MSHSWKRTRLNPPLTLIWRAVGQEVAFALPQMMNMSREWSWKRSCIKSRRGSNKVLLMLKMNSSSLKSTGPALRTSWPSLRKRQMRWKEKQLKSRRGKEVSSTLKEKKARNQASLKKKKKKKKKKRLILWRLWTVHTIKTHLSHMRKSLASTQQWCITLVTKGNTIMSLKMQSFVLVAARPL